MLKQRLQILFNVLFLSIVISCYIWQDLIIYGISQGKGQLSIVWNSEPIPLVLKNDTLTQAFKQKLLLIGEIRSFAFDSIGIDENHNYTDFYDQRNKPSLLTISACEPYSLKAKEWTFPFLGTVSYKGYFDKRKAEKEILALRMKSYDIDVYTPSGWSTLGWFKDPVLSNMLKKSEGSLANLIIHELTHGTLYVKNNVTFNENLANFIGDKGAEQFLTYRFGKNSREFIRYQQNKSDEKIYNDYILECSTKLEKLYATNEFKSLDENSRKEKKTEFISSVVKGVYKIGLQDPKGYLNYTLQAFFEGNAFFMAFTRYDSQYELFEKEYKEKYKSDLRTYLNAMKELYPSL
ncbi:MAG: aminopeptidase [Bacteroidota bacterium]|nr:aminopeptidase [Bacteroidota bacterium]